MSNTNNYDRQVQSQIAQYADVVEMHDSSPAADWLNEKYLSPRLKHVFGVSNPIEIYARTFAAAVLRTGTSDIVSLGSGYGALEIAIVKLARTLNLPSFRIICLELSPVLVNRIRRSAVSEGVAEYIEAQEADLNLPLSLPNEVAAFMAHHALHHFVSLELLFDQISEYMHPEGSFVTMDMIGRNGHMRWPESLQVIRDIWPALPARLKWDRLFSRLDSWYENWDCSIEGFEGIRSQDILPELINRFRFEYFHANFGITDVFVDRRFGENFSVSNEEDVHFLERIQRYEDELIRDNIIKPTQIFAVMRSLRSTTCPIKPRCFPGMSPEKALRPVNRPHKASRSLEADYLFESPYRDTPFAPPLYKASLNHDILFGSDYDGIKTVRWGWCEPDKNFIWSSGLDSAIEFETASTISQLKFRIRHHTAEFFPGQVISIFLNGVSIMTIDQFDKEEYVSSLPEAVKTGRRNLIEFHNSRPRRPDIDGGTDSRPLGFALVSIKAS